MQKKIETFWGNRAGFSFLRLSFSLFFCLSSPPFPQLSQFWLGGINSSVVNDYSFPKLILTLSYSPFTELLRSITYLFWRLTTSTLVRQPSRWPITICNNVKTPTTQRSVVSLLVTFQMLLVSCSHHSQLGWPVLKDEGSNSLSVLGRSQFPHLKS